MSAADTIFITGISVIGYHGVLSEERRAGQEFGVDIELDADLSRAAEADDLSNTVDYAGVVADVSDIIAGEPVNLIETLAERIAAAMLVRDAVQAVRVTVHKPQAPIDAKFDDVGIRLERSR